MYKTQNPEVIARQKLHDKKVHLQLFSEQYYAGFATARKSSGSAFHTRWTKLTLFILGGLIADPARLF